MKRFLTFGIYNGVRIRFDETGLDSDQLDFAKSCAKQLKVAGPAIKKGTNFFCMYNTEVDFAAGNFDVIAPQTLAEAKKSFIDTFSAGGDSYPKTGDTFTTDELIAKVPAEYQPQQRAAFSMLKEGGSYVWPNAKIIIEKGAGELWTVIAELDDDALNMPIDPVIS